MEMTYVTSLVMSYRFWLWLVSFLISAENSCRIFVPQKFFFVNIPKNNFFFITFWKSHKFDLPVKIISFKSAVDADDDVLGLAIISDENGDNSLSVETVDEGDDEFCWLVFTSNIELEWERNQEFSLEENMLRSHPHIFNATRAPVQWKRWEEEGKNR